MKNDIITIAHGGGGIKTHALIKDIIQKHLSNPVLDQLDDSAAFNLPHTAVAFTTDSYVVNPIFFPGGDIGKLAICGTVNDLAMQAAEPKYMSMGLILEEGFAVSDLEKIIVSMKSVIGETGVILACGDTKVVERGKGSGIFINTSGIGIRCPGVDVHVSNAREGDAVIISGTIGDHGIAIMSCRKQLKFETTIVSDVAPLWQMVMPLIGEIPSLHCMRDPTRGGLAAALCDIAARSEIGIEIEESLLPIRDQVRGACGLLGLDPLHVANEGKAVIVCAEADASLALRLLHKNALGSDARIIGKIVSRYKGTVLLRTPIGGERIVEMSSGEELPRIC